MKNFTRYMALTCALILSPQLTNASALTAPDTTAVEEIIRPGLTFHNRHPDPVTVSLTNGNGLDERFDLAGKPADAPHSQIILNLLRDEKHRYATLTVTQGAETLCEQMIDTSALVSLSTSKSVFVCLEVDDSPASQIAPQFVIDEMLAAFAGRRPMDIARQNILDLWEGYTEKQRKILKKPSTDRTEEDNQETYRLNFPSCLHCFNSQDVFPYNSNLLRNAQYANLMTHLPDATPEEYALAEQELIDLGMPIYAH